jgi:hypothetical protein
MGGASNVEVYTIAAPSPGNAGFAAYYNALFSTPSGRNSAFRFFNSLDVVPNAWASLGTVETYYPPLLSCPADITNITRYAEKALGTTYVQLGDLAAGSAVELSGTLVTPFDVRRGRLGLNPFEDALFLWEAAQQHACTTYQALLETPLTLVASGNVRRTLAALRKQGQAAP